MLLIASIIVPFMIVSWIIGHFESNMINANWEKFDGYFSSVIRTEELTAKDLEKAVRRAWSTWYRHRVLHKFSWKDVSHILKSIPCYLRYPAATINQVKRLFYG